jgi:hypothetical protein
MRAGIFSLSLIFIFIYLFIFFYFSFFSMETVPSKDLPTTTQWSINAIDNSSSFAYAGMWRAVYNVLHHALSVFARPFMQKIPALS